MHRLLNFLKLKEKGSIEGMVTIIKTDSKTGEVISVMKQKNRIMLGTNTGKSLILNRLGGDNTYTMNILYGEIGSGTNTPADGDTALQTPVARVAVVDSVVASNVITFRFFFADGVLANGAYNEFGSFVDGSATIGTGKIFNRALFGSTYNKASGEDTTVQLEITLN